MNSILAIIIIFYCIKINDKIYNIINIIVLNKTILVNKILKCIIKWDYIMIIDMHANVKFCVF